MSISKDSTRCLVLGGPPDYVLTMWDMERSTASASIRHLTITKKEIVSADVCPTNNTLVSITGKKIIRMFHVTNKNGKFMPVKTNLKMESQNYSTQTWLASSGELVVGTETGSLVVMEDKETKQLLIRSIIKLPLMFSNDDCNDDDYKETEIVPSLNQSTQCIDSLIPNSGSLFVDCCAWTPLVAIGGYDEVIRLFNYHTNQVVLTHRLDDRSCNLSFHPSGEYLLVSTPTTVRLCSVLADTLNVSWQVEDLQQTPDLFLNENVSTLRALASVATRTS